MAKKLPTAARTLLLSREESARYAHDLANADEPYDFAASVLHGSIAMREDFLEQAARIARTFYQTCRALHAKIPHDQELRALLLRPLAHLPVTRAAALAAPFFLGFFRMDFFLEEETGTLRIMEVNSGGASLTDYLRCMRHLPASHCFEAPDGCERLTKETMLRCLANECRKLDATSIGFAAVENGHENYLWDYLEYAEFLRGEGITPIFLELKNGDLSLMDHPNVPCPFKHLSELDAVFTDWFEDMEKLEKVETLLTRHDIRRIPSRADLLFESKHFLSVLQKIDRPRAITAHDWSLLQGALLPSFPLEELEARVEEIKTWPGIVLKMDLDCASENVFLYDFEKTSLEETLAVLQRKSLPSSTWTLQKLVHPPHLPLAGKTISGIETGGAPYRYDLMTYVCMENDMPHVLFGSRLFSREKWDELTEEGIEDGLLAPVGVL